MQQFNYRKSQELKVKWSLTLYLLRIVSKFDMEFMDERIKIRNLIFEGNIEAAINQVNNLDKMV